MKIDTHLHVWNMEKVDYPWLIPDYGPIYRTFEADEVAPQVKAAGVDKAVLVQAMDSYADTQYMFDTAAKHDWIGGIVGWVPLLKPDEAAEKLMEFKKNPLFKGMRHLIHEEKDPDWVIQDTVIEGLKVLASMGMTFDVVAVFPNHLKHVPTLSARVPNLKIVIDHLAKPPQDADARKVWQDQMKAAAENPNVFAKVSGLNTTTPDFANWTADDIKPAMDFALQTFGADRLMFGSDWPVAILAGTYAKVWEETNKVLATYTAAERDAILGGSAQKFYNVS